MEILDLLLRRAFLERAVVELVYKFDTRKFEKVSQSLKYESKIVLVHKHIIWTPTPLALLVQGKKKAGARTWKVEPRR